MINSIILSVLFLLTSVLYENEATDAQDKLFEGDIILTRAQVNALQKARGDRTKRQAMVPDSDFKLWPRNIFVRYHKNFPNGYKDNVERAIDMYSRLTCLRFTHSEDSKDEVIEFIHEEGCSSHVGMTLFSSVHDVYLGLGCDSLRTAIHEMGHAIGLWHTHIRHDRDQYVEIEIDSIQKELLEFFSKKSEQFNNNLGVPYDYGSVMHYSSKTFAHDGQTALKAKDPLYQQTMGSPFQSFYDIKMINLLYNCTGNCAGSSTVCANGGYPNPNNCSLCICPSGYAGLDCTEVFTFNTLDDDNTSTLWTVISFDEGNSPIGLKSRIFKTFAAVEKILCDHAEKQRKVLHNVMRYDKEDLFPVLSSSLQKKVTAFNFQE